MVGTREISDLPINGRRVDSFVLNTPGVTNDATFGLLTFRGVAGNNSFLLDGNDNTEQFYDENAGRTRIQSQISADAVQEFQVVSANVSAEYGRAMGGVVNTVTKSGTQRRSRQPHSIFCAAPASTPTIPTPHSTPPEHRIQTGGTVGGAIVKDKLFYFLSADITRRNFPFVDSQVKAGFLDSVNQVWLTAAALRLRPPSATPSTRCCRASTGRFPAPATTTCISAGSTITSTTRTPSAPASISCAGGLRTAFRPVSPPPPARELPATATIQRGAYATGRLPGPP